MRKIQVRGRLETSVGDYLFVAKLFDNKYVGVKDEIVNGGYGRIHQMSLDHCDYVESRFIHPIWIKVREPLNSGLVYPVTSTSERPDGMYVENYVLDPTDLYVAED